jgi:hypothetical protein
MIRVLLALATLLLFTAPSFAEPARIGPADTGLPANPALGAPTMAVPSGSSSTTPRPVSPPQASSGTLPPSTSTTSQPSEACRKFPNLC